YKRNCLNSNPAWLFLSDDHYVTALTTLFRKDLTVCSHSLPILPFALPNHWGSSKCDLVHYLSTHFILFKAYILLLSNLSIHLACSSLDTSLSKSFLTDTSRYSLTTSYTSLVYGATASTFLMKALHYPSYPLITDVSLLPSVPLFPASHNF